MLPLLVISLAILGTDQKDNSSFAESFQDTCQPPPVPADLPEPKAAPAEGRWINADGTDGGSGTWLPGRLDEDVLMRLHLLDQSPTVCASIIRAERARCTTLIQAELDASLAGAGADRVRSDARSVDGWSTWQVAFLSVGVFALGASVGGVVVLVAR